MSGEILTESGVNPEGRPFVAMMWGGERCQFTPAEARAFALVVLEAAEAALHDAAFVAWLQGPPLGLTLRQAAEVLAEQRQYRADLGEAT